MGITLHAIVEWKADGKWYDFAEFQFNKYYPDRAMVTDFLPEGWPKDASIEQWARDERSIDSGMHHADLGTLSEAVVQCEHPDDPNTTDARRGAEYASPAMRGMIGAMAIVGNAGYETRALFWME